ncbi:MAG: hypothetical protein ACRYGG_03125 [Janthinobacterium lividum]
MKNDEYLSGGLKESLIKIYSQTTDDRIYDIYSRISDGLKDVHIYTTATLFLIENVVLPYFTNSMSDVSIHINLLSKAIKNFCNSYCKQTKIQNKIILEVERMHSQNARNTSCDEPIFMIFLKDLFSKIGSYIINPPTGDSSERIEKIFEESIMFIDDQQLGNIKDLSQNYLLTHKSSDWDKEDSSSTSDNKMELTIAPEDIYVDEIESDEDSHDFMDQNLNNPISSNEFDNKILGGRSSFELKVLDGDASFNKKLDGLNEILSTDSPQIEDFDEEINDLARNISELVVSKDNQNTNRDGNNVVLIDTNNKLWEETRLATVDISSSSFDYEKDDNRQTAVCEFKLPHETDSMIQSSFTFQPFAQDRLTLKANKKKNKKLL